MQKIAIISPNKYKYSETFIHMHVNELPVEVHLLHGGYFPEMASRSLDGADVTLLKSPPTANWWERLWGRSAEKIRERCLKDALAMYLFEEDIDLVLAEYGPSGEAVWDLVTAIDLPLVVHFHGYDAYRADILGEQGRRYPELFANAHALIVVSRHMRDQLLRLGAPAEKLCLIPYGVNTAAFRSAQAPAAAAPAAPYFLALGRLTPKKAPLRTIEAFAAVAALHPEARLVMAGDGEMMAACQALRAEYGLAGRIDFPGAVDHAAVPAVLAGAVALVQHSVTTENGDSEGLPLAILEAMAAGIPVIATRHAGIPDAVTHGVHGLLCAEGDVAGMAAHMLQVLEAPETARAMGAAGQLRAAQEFDQARYLADLMRVINDWAPIS